MRPAYKTKYGYPWRGAIVAEFWWRVEHLGPQRIRSIGYAHRKSAERRYSPLLEGER